MTRPIVYFTAVTVLIAATVMTIVSVVVPKWVTYTRPGSPVYDNVGLHRRCMSGSECTEFPDPKRCDGGEEKFCSTWRTLGFLMSFAIVVELATLVSFLIIMAGGKQKREKGWKLLGTMLAGVATIQFIAMALVTYLFNYDDLFLVSGYSLDTSFYLCTASASVSLLCAFGLAISAYVLPPEDGYEFLNDSAGV
ncbi:hypothetical protein B0H66DRAFT_530501 [Apodospora peruviana]|uniref:Pre-mRNA splicing factor n=1 Tax=Apodospora peruviana TaxID=516989 RepID=A0AAE0IJX0_9PEZI|nr:hypothetical protein B0H66DRAFT_530501 [Apodospora peruviana]